MNPQGVQKRFPNASLDLSSMSLWGSLRDLSLFSLACRPYFSPQDRGRKEVAFTKPTTDGS